MGSDLYLAWSEHWPEVLKVEDFTDRYIDVTLKRERRLTSALIRALSRLAKVKRLKKPLFSYEFPLKSVPWEYTTPHETVYTAIETVNWDESSYKIQDNPVFLPVAQRIEYIKKKYTRRYFSYCYGNSRICKRWVDTDLLWFGKGENFGYILRGWVFDEERDIHLSDIIDIGEYYNEQNWESVRQRAVHYISEYGGVDDAPRRLRHVLEVADTVLASEEPEKFMVVHDW